MKNLNMKKLSQAILKTRNKLMLCATIDGAELNEDEVSGLTAIIEDCCDELEQAANTIALLPEGDYAKRKGAGRGLLHAVPKPLELAKETQTA